MRLNRASSVLAVTLIVSGCHSRYAPPESPMPPNTILLSQMMRELSAQPGFRDAVVQAIEGNTQGKRGPALLTPRLATELRKLTLGADWQGLDRFPGWTIREINPTVRVVSRVASRRAKEHATDTAEIDKYLDLGPYALDHQQTVSFDEPSPLPPFTTEGIVSQ